MQTDAIAYRTMTLRVLPSAVRMMFSPLRADDERWPLMEYHPAADASASTRLMPVGSMLKKSFHIFAALYNSILASGTYSLQACLSVLEKT